MRKMPSLRRDGTSPHLRQVFLPPSTIIGLALFIGVFYGLFTRSTIPTALTVSCDANSNVRIKYDSLVYSPASLNQYWDPSLFLGITLGFGRFTFSSVRTIDGLWDVVVARCGQALGALLAYSVLRRSLSTEMERSSASLSLFATMAFDKVSVTA